MICGAGLESFLASSSAESRQPRVRLSVNALGKLIGLRVQDLRPFFTIPGAVDHVCPVGTDRGNATTCRFAAGSAGRVETDRIPK